MFYSTYIFKERDSVPITGFILSDDIQHEFKFMFKSGNKHEAAYFLRQAAKFVKNKKFLRTDGVQFCILTSTCEDKIPVDHFYWEDDKKFPSRIDFTNGAYYIGFCDKDGEVFYKKNKALKRLANLIQKG